MSNSAAALGVGGAAGGAPPLCAEDVAKASIVATAVAAPRWYIQPRELLSPAVDVSFEPRHAPGVADALRALGHDLVPTAEFDSNVGHEHAIELIDGGPAAGGSLQAATDPRSEGLPAVW